MGKQKEELRDHEKEWLEVQYHRADVQAVLNGRSDSFIADAAKLVHKDYKEVFADPLPAESEEAYLRWLKNASKDDKPNVFRKPTERPEDVEARVDNRCLHIRNWFKGRARRAKKDKPQDVIPPPPVPPLTPRRRARGLGGLDVFANSPLRQELLPPSAGQWQGAGAHRHNLAEAFRALAPEVRAQFITQAHEQNAQRMAEALEEAGSSEELARSLKVGNVHEWFEDVMAQLRVEVQWVGAVLLGGPDEKGDIKMINASNGLDNTGQDFWGALSHAVGWQHKTLMRFSVNWFERAFCAPVPPPVFVDANVPSFQGAGGEELANGGCLLGTQFGDPLWGLEASANNERPLPPPIFELSGVPVVQLGGRGPILACPIDEVLQRL